MSDYKYLNQEQTMVLKYEGNWHITEGGKGWDEFLAYRDAGGEVDPWITKEEAYNQVLRAIDDENRNKNLAPFLYDKGDGTGEHKYEADNQSIQAVQNQCLTMPTTDPIPVPNGVWKTLDVQEDGITPVYVPYTVEEFLAFATAYFMRGSNNFGVKEVHKSNLTELYLDPDSTVDDILNYDYSTGWL